jgi:hypothetical protein
MKLPSASLSSLSIIQRNCLFSEFGSLSKEKFIDDSVATTVVSLKGVYLS